MDVQTGESHLPGTGGMKRFGPNPADMVTLHGGEPHECVTTGALDAG